MKKPKVLFVLHLPPPMHGAAMMGNYLRQSKVIGEETEAHFINLATNKILNQSGKGSFKKAVTFISLIKQLTRALRKDKFDLCYMTLTASGAGFYKDAVVVAVIKMWNRNIIYHFHNKGVSAPKNRFTDLLYRFVFKGTKSILLSKYLYEDIRQYVDKKNVFYCPNGIPSTNVSVYNENLQEEKENKCCQLLYLSNMMREKGIFDVLDACQLIKEKGIRFSCHFVGGWLNVSQDEFRSEIRKRSLEDLVIAHGPKYGEEKEEFYKASHVFVFPTFYDTFPLVCLEAMQHNMAIVSTPEGGIPDIVVDGETGFLVPQHNAKILAEKLITLIENKEIRMNMQRAGRQRYEELFTLSKWEQNMVQVIREAAY